MTEEMPLRLNTVQVGWRVKHFRPRRNGEFLHGTVVQKDYGDKWCGDKWCRVRWDGKKTTGLVMVECLIASEKAAD